MSKALKIVLWVLVGLVVVGGLAVGGLLVFRRLSVGELAMPVGPRAMMGGDERLAPGFTHPFERMPGMRMPRNFNMPNMPFRDNMRGMRMGGFFPFGLIAGGLFGLAVLALIVMGIIFLARSLRHPSQPAVAAVPAAQTVCPNCGRGVQAEWSHCAYCGTGLHTPPPAEPPAE